MKYFSSKKKAAAHQVMGVEAPTPRLTFYAVRLALLYMALPLIVLLALLDLVLYFVFERLFGVCYGVFCLF